MKPRLVMLVLLSLPAFAPGNAQSTHKRAPNPVVSSPQQIAETIQRLEAEMRIAIMKGDASWFEQHLAEHYTETDDQGKLKSREEVIQFFRTTQPEYETWNLSEGTAQTFNGNTVILTGKVDLDGTVRGQHVSGAFRFTRVWIKQGLDWQLATTQYTRITG
jgi:Domain of unknown function (DUF4440)